MFIWQSSRITLESLVQKDIVDMKKGWRSLKMPSLPLFFLSYWIYFLDGKNNLLIYAMGVSHVYHSK